MKKYTAWEKTKHAAGLTWFIIRETARLLTKKWMWLIIALMVWTYLIAWFNANYAIKTSFTFGIYPRATLQEKQQEGGKDEHISTPSAYLLKEVQAKELTDKDIIGKAKNADILYGVYFLESTNGTKDGCKEDGQFNGFGYGQNNTVWNCFPSFQVVVDKVDAWFTKYLGKGYTVDEALCFYNTGTRQPQCQYSLKYHSL